MGIFSGNPDPLLQSKHEEQITQLKHEHERELAERDRSYDIMDSKHKARFDKIDLDYSTYKNQEQDRTARLQTQHDAEFDVEAARNERREAELTAKIEGLEDLENSHQENVTNAAQLESERTVFEAEKSAFGDVKTAVKRARDEGAANAEAEYTKGYADGLSDGLRKGMEHTKGDRESFEKLAHKIIDKPEREFPALPEPQVVVVGPAASVTKTKNKD